MIEDRYGISIVWPEFTVEDIIGEGTFGVVYKVYKESFGIRYYSAVKVVPIPKEQSDIESYRADGMDDLSIEAYCEELVKRLSKEINFMESLKAVPNIVTIDDFTVRKQAEGPGWIVYIRMELLTNLNKYRERYGLDTAGVVKLGIDISRGLEYCSRRNIIHRDIKPANIFVNNFGDFKLGDFGISREGDVTNMRSKQGSPPYMAPEVVRQESYNSTIDIYSLGIVLYRLMNDNRLPFYPPADRPVGFEDSQAANEKRLAGVPMPAPVHADKKLASIILKACAYRSKDRFQSAAELREALEDYQKNSLPKSAGKGNKAGSLQAQGGASMSGALHGGAPQSGTPQQSAPAAGGSAFSGQGMQPGYQIQGEAGDGTVPAPEVSYSYSGRTPASGSYYGQGQSGNSYGRQGYGNPYGQQTAGSNPYGQQTAGSGSYGQQTAGSGSYGQQTAGSGSYGQQSMGSSYRQAQPGNSYSQPKAGDSYRKSQAKTGDKGRKLGIQAAVGLLIAAGIIFAVFGVKAVQNNQSNSLQQAPSGSSDQVVLAQKESARESEEYRKKSESESQKASEDESQKASEEESRRTSEAESQKLSEAESESQKSSEEESQKASEEESQKSSEEESQKASEEESQKSSEAESQKSSEEESQKSSEEESQKSSEEESQKTSEAESQKASEAESQKTSEADAQQASEAESQKVSESQQASEAESQQASEEESQKASEAESQQASEDESQKASESESQQASEAESQQAAEAEAQAAAESAPLKYLVTKETHLYNSADYDSENVDVTVPAWSVISGNDQSGEENDFLSVDGPVETWKGWIPKKRLAPYTDYVTCFEQISKENLDDMESAAKEKVAAYCQEQGIDADFTLYGYEMRYSKNQSETQEDNNDLALLFASGNKYLPVVFRNLQITELGAVSHEGELLAKAGIITYDDKNVLFYDEAGFGDRMLTTDSDDDLTAYSNLMAEPQEQYVTLTTADPVDGQDYYDSLDYWDNNSFDIWTGSAEEQSS